MDYIESRLAVLKTACEDLRREWDELPDHGYDEGNLSVLAWRVVQTMQDILRHDCSAKSFRSMLEIIQVARLTEELQPVE